MAAKAKASPRGLHVNSSEDPKITKATPPVAISDAPISHLVTDSWNRLDATARRTIVCKAPIMVALATVVLRSAVKKTASSKPKRMPGKATNLIFLRLIRLPVRK